MPLRHSVGAADLQAMMQTLPLAVEPCADSDSAALRCCVPSGKSAAAPLSTLDVDADAEAATSPTFQQSLHDACLSARTCSASSRHSDCAQTDDDEEEEEQTDVDADAFRSPSPSPTAGAHDNQPDTACSSAFSSNPVPAAEVAPTPSFFVAAPFSPCFTSLATLAATAAALGPQSQTQQQVSPPPVAAPVLFDFASRFRIVRTLQSTLFGAQLLCEDLQASPVVGADGCVQHPLVVVKESSWSRMEQKRSSAQVGEDVRKEARIMRWLGVERTDDAANLLHNLNTPNHPTPVILSNAHIDRNTCGLSEAFWNAHADPATGLLSQNALESLAVGARFIAPLHGEFDTSSSGSGGDRKHYLATGFAAHGDLFGVVSNAPGGRLTEVQARPIFLQLLQAVQYSHARSVAHLDLSIENTCLTADGEVRLIDWGLAVLHAQCGSEPMGGQGAATIDPVKRLALANDLASSPTTTRMGLPCICVSCRSTPAQLAQRESAQIEQCLLRFPDLASQVALAAPSVLAEPHPLEEGMMDIDSGACQRLVPPSARSVLSRSRPFLMRPVCELQMRPGKPFTTAPELADPHRLAGPWDAYATDSFALGVLLFVLLTGRPPFRTPDSRTDTWFRWMSSGDWLVRERTWGGAHAALCTHYTHLSANACALIDLCFKPQHLRPTADQMIAHPWMDERHQGSATPLHQ